MKTSSSTAIPGVSASSRASRTNWQPAAVRGWSSEILEKMQLWYGRARQRRQLSHLNDRLLSDIGVDRFDAEQESRKPFWQA